MAEEVADYKSDIVGILSSICNPDAMKPEDARAGNVDVKIDENKLHRRESFGKLLEEDQHEVGLCCGLYNSEELIKKSISALDRDLQIKPDFYHRERGRNGYHRIKASTGSIVTIPDMMIR